MGPGIDFTKTDSLKDLHNGPSEAKVEAVEIGKDAELASSSDVDGLGFKTEFEVRK
jgi:hypothetical protein